MFKQLNISNSGPVPYLELELGERLNILTGDNGLGKSFILDIIWWALTRKWPGEINPNLPCGLMALPNNQEQATIEFSFTTAKNHPLTYKSEFERKTQSWTGKAGRPAIPGMVLYAMVDGSFAVWDPARNYWQKKGNADIQERHPAYVFSPREVWDGLRAANGDLLCNGLLSDWATWQNENGKEFSHLKEVLNTLSPLPNERIEPGPLTRRFGDPRKIPTLKMPYGQVPVLHASAGIRRIISLAYLLVWSWSEHQLASQQLGSPTVSQIIFLVDEIEAHLHPHWQRLIVGSLLAVMEKLSQNIQLITATHSPLVMASLEPLFEDQKDAWFDLDHEPSSASVTLTKRPFQRRGDATHWLTSKAFDLNSGRSVEAETILAEATEALISPQFDANQARLIHTKLRGVLSDIDPFWMRWRSVAEQKGWLP